MGLRNWGLARAAGRGRGQETGALTDQQFKEGRWRVGRTVIGGLAD